MKYARYTYKINDSGSVRIIVDEKTEEVFFCARDVAKAFGFREPGKAANDRCLNVVKAKHKTPGGVQTLNFITKEEVNRLAETNIDIGKIRYISILSLITEEVVGKTRRKNDDRLIDRISSAISAANRDGRGEEIDAVFITPGGRSFRISPNGSICELME